MKNYIQISFLLISLFLFSGCSLFPFGTAEPSIGGILKTFDGGKTWMTKNTINEEENLSRSNVLSMAINPENSDNLYVGTRNRGIFVTKDGGEIWNKVSFTPKRTYGLVINHNNPEIIYASGLWRGRGKIYKSISAGKEWEEIYTEPEDGTIITALNMSEINPDIIYAGTNEGFIIRTLNGGETWENIHQANGPVSDIVFDNQNSDVAYFAIYEKDVLITRDGGKSFNNLEENQADNQISLPSVYSIGKDPSTQGLLYIGTGNGLFKSSNYGENIEELSILSSSKELPIRAVAVNPRNSSEIVYNSAQGIYKSSDSGRSWATFQLETSKMVSKFLYNHENTSIIYAGLREY